MSPSLILAILGYALVIMLLRHVLGTNAHCVFHLLEDRNK